jgi:integrase
MARYQKGYVFEASNAFHVRYVVTEIVDGRACRVQRSERLCPKDNRYYSKTCKPVRQLCAQVMERVNAQTEPSKPEVAATDFWQKTYLPHLEKNTKPSTLNGYRKIWEAHFINEFAARDLTEYETHHATKFLTKLAESGLGTRTIAHIRSLASGMFRHALRLNEIKSNPWRDAGSLTQAKRPEATAVYTLEQAETISDALVSSPPAQLVFALAAFMGLRPGEISGLKWSDIDDSWIHIRRSAWRGIVGTTKTDESVASIPLIEPVKSMILSWKAISGQAQWLFPSNRGDRPMNISQYAQRTISPILREKKIKWHGLYAGRRSAATLLVQLTGNAVAAQYVLRHKNIATTQAFYIKPIQSAAVEGMKLVETTLANRRLAGKTNSD